MNNNELLSRYSDHINGDPYLAKSTKASYLSDVRYFIGFLGVHDALSVTPDTIILLIRHMLAEKRSSSGIHRMIVSVRNFYKFLKTAGFVIINPVKDFNVKKVNELTRSNG